MTNNEFKQMLINRSFILAKKIISLSDKFPNKRAAWVITDQLIRAATSVGANIIEAQAASSRKDFTNFLNYALKSGNETIFWLNLTKDTFGNSLEEIKPLIKEVEELTKILGSSLLKLKGKTHFQRSQL